MHPARLIALGHFLVDNAATRRHPLHIPSRDGAAISHAVAVLHGSRQHVGNRLDAAMRMPRKAGEVILRNIVTKIVQKQEGIELGRLSESKCTPQMHPGALQGGLSLNQSLYRPDRHLDSS